MINWCCLRIAYSLSHIGHLSLSNWKLSKLPLESQGISKIILWWVIKADLSHITFYLSHVTCHLSLVSCKLSLVSCHLSFVIHSKVLLEWQGIWKYMDPACRPVMCHLSTGVKKADLSLVNYHLSHVTCNMSLVSCNCSLFTYLLSFVNHLEVLLEWQGIQNYMTWWTIQADLSLVTCHLSVVTFTCPPCLVSQFMNRP